MDYFFLPSCCISPLRQQLPALMRRESGDLEAGEATERIKPYIKIGCRFAYESKREEGGEGMERRKQTGGRWGGDGAERTEVPGTRPGLRPSLPVGRGEGLGSWMR